MNRKDYIGMCNALANGIHTGKMMDAICDWLSKDNPRFNREKFETFIKQCVANRKEEEHAPF